MRALRLLSALFALAPADIGVTDGVVKVRPLDPVPHMGTAVIRAAKNEFETFQIVIGGGSGGLTNVSATAPALTSARGTAIPAANVRLYREALMNLATPSNIEGATGAWPDPLIPDFDEIYGEKRNAFPFRVPAGENRVILADVLVPVTAEPGIYTGTLTVTADETGPMAVPVSLEVWDFALPSTASLASFFDMNGGGLCQAHFGGYDACGQDAGEIALLVLYGRFLLDHRITAGLIYYGPNAAAGGGFDWAGSFDNFYGPLFDGTDPASRLAGAKITTAHYSWPADVEHYSAWADHFRSKDWFDRTFDYTFDEPDPNNASAWSTIAARTALIHGAVPDFRTLVTTSIDNANAKNVTSSINILAPTVNTMDDKLGVGSPYEGNQRPKYDAFLASNPNDRLWWYQGCTSHGCNIVGGDYFTRWPNVMIDASGVQNRAMEWLSFTYRVNAELYFDVDYTFGADPWNSVYAFGGNGDGTLLYPGRPDVIGGTHHIPIASYRITMIREGMEDYEYLKLVSDLGDPTFARRAAEALFPTTHDVHQSGDALMSARAALAARILELNGSTRPPVSLVYPSKTASYALTIDGTREPVGGLAPIHRNVGAPAPSGAAPSTRAHPHTGCGGGGAGNLMPALLPLAIARLIRRRGPRGYAARAPRA